MPGRSDNGPQGRDDRRRRCDRRRARPSSGATVVAATVVAATTILVGPKGRYDFRRRDDCRRLRTSSARRAATTFVGADAPGRVRRVRRAAEPPRERRVAAEGQRRPSSLHRNKDPPPATRTRPSSRESYARTVVWRVVREDGRLATPLVPTVVRRPPSYRPRSEDCTEPRGGHRFP